MPSPEELARVKINKLLAHARRALFVVDRNLGDQMLIQRWAVPAVRYADDGRKLAA